MRREILLGALLWKPRPATVSSMLLELGLKAGVTELMVARGVANVNIQSPIQVASLAAANITITSLLPDV